MFPTILAGKCRRRCVSRLRDDGCCLVDVLIDKVTQSNNLAAVDVHHAVYGALCTHTKSHETYLYAPDRLASQLHGAVKCLVAFVHYLLFVFAK
jgi:hypothetical protein